VTKLFKILLIYTLSAALGQVVLAQNFQLQRPYFEKDGQKLELPSLGGLNSPQFANIDLDRDGKLDILILEKNSGKIIPLLRKAEKHEIDYSLLNSLPPLSDWIICKDYNNDGKMDIFTSAPGGISLYKNISTNNLQFELVTELVNSLRVYESQSFTANIFVTFSDIPFIDDLDGDGDLDILTFSLGGNTIEHHKNLSIEKTGLPDIDFQMVNTCYAYVTDDFSGSAFELGISECLDNVANPTKRAKHSGFTFNFRPGNPKSILVGELNSSKIVELAIGQSQFGGDSAISQNKSYPSQAPDNLLFVAAYSGKFDLDETEDLLLASNIRGSSTENSVWLYDENHILKKNNFLQDQTIEVGEHVKATTLDWDADGDQDLILSSAVRNDFLLPQISFWENVGSSTNPQFQFTKKVTGDFSLSPPLSISSHQLQGTQTILIGNSEGVVWEVDFTDLFNNGFNSTRNILKDENDNPIAGSGKSAPIKIIYEGEETLLIGNNTGRIKQFTKSGNSYILTNAFFKNIDLKGSSLTQELSLSILQDSLWVFTQNSQAYTYSLADASPVGVLRLDYKNYVGIRSTGNLIDITGDNAPEILIGTDDGGLLTFSQSVISSIHESQKKQLTLYPNPTQSELRIQGTKGKIDYDIYDTSGRVLIQGSTENFINVQDLNPGVYHVLFHNSSIAETHTFWKQ
jgi:hypothetical protein